MREFILIISDSLDNSTNLILSYINYYKTDFIRYNEITYNNLSKTEHFRKHLKNCKSIWIRRGGIQDSNIYNPVFINEFKVFKDYIHYTIEKDSRAIGSLTKDFYHNKLIDLEIAKSIDLQTPNFFIAINKNKLIRILKQNDNKKYITKSLYNPISINSNETSRYTFGYTSEVCLENINLLANDFFPSLIQEKIEKLFEIRVFYLKKTMYSVAIFSQENEETKLDYRHYDVNKRNRMIPFSLPKNIKIKLINLMNKLELKTGSIDLILTPQYKYIFLEVNSLGQFGGVSGYCNYHLEKKIAEELI